MFRPKGLGPYRPVPVGGLSVVYAAVEGFAERKGLLGSEFDFVVEVYWSDGRTTFVKRTYDDFVEFQRRVTDSFRVQSQSGNAKIPVFIPKLEGRKLFTRYTRDVAENRETELHAFLKELLEGNPLISGSAPVIEFFQRRPSDPAPSTDNQASSSDIQSGTEDIGLSSADDDEDDVIFAR